MRCLLVATRIHVQAAAQEDTIQPIQESIDFALFADRRKDDREPSGRENGIAVARIESSVGGCSLAGSDEVGIDADDWPG
jgi:hypothetical protein